MFTGIYLEKARQVFLNPSPSFGWEPLIVGVRVETGSGRSRRMTAVAGNTFRGFHRNDKSLPGARAAFVGFFLDEARRLQEGLASVRDSHDLEGLSEWICTGIRGRLSNCRSDQLASFNKIRKPVDLYLEHLVAMAGELASVRAKLVPLLHVPLDSQIFAHEYLFTEVQLTSRGLSRRATFQAVRTEGTYRDLQRILRDKAEEISREHGEAFAPIYFDLVWNDRYRRDGGNLFAASA